MSSPSPVELYPWDAPNGVKLLITWLAPMVAPGATETERPTGAILPFIRVLRSNAPDDGLTDKGKYGIYVFGEDEVATSDLANQVKRRIQLLAPRFGGQVPVAVDDKKFYVDKVRVLEAPHPLDYMEDSIPRSLYMYMGLFEVWIRIAAA